VKQSPPPLFLLRSDRLSTQSEAHSISPPRGDRLSPGQRRRWGKFRFAWKVYALRQKREMGWNSLGDVENHTPLNRGEMEWTSLRMRS